MLLKRTSIILVAVVLAVSGCKPRSTGTPTTFIFARGSDSQKLDPADVDDGESVNALAQVMEGLVRLRSGTFEVEPCLAESWEVTPDGLTYTFKIREGVRFHDGTPLDAEAARYSFARQMDPAHPAHLPEANFQYWNYLYQEVNAVEAVDSRTLVFRLSSPNSSLLYSLAIFPAWLVSPRALETHGAEFQRHPVGTGPYRFSSWSPNQAIVFEKNPDYWDRSAPPQFERIVMKVVPENTVRLLELRAGRVHGIDGLQPAELRALRDDPSLRVYNEPGMNVGYLAFQMENPKFAEAEVREAFAMAINLEELRQVALDGSGTVARLPIPPGFLGDDGDRSHDIPFDPDSARRILAKYSERWKTPVTLHVMTAPRPFLPEPVKAASLIRASLERVGVPVEIIAKDFKTHLDLTRDGAFELAILGWIGDNGDTDNFLSILFGSWAAEKGAATNISFYKNAEMDRLLLAARAEVDEGKRAGLYKEALAVWRRDLPIIPLLHGDNIAVMRREVTGFQLQGPGDLRLGPVGWKNE